MKKIILSFALFLFLFSCSSSKSNDYQLTKNYTPDNPELYQTIVKLDSIFFDAYNHCDTKFETAY